MGSPLDFGRIGGWVAAHSKKNTLVCLASVADPTITLADVYDGQVSAMEFRRNFGPHDAIDWTNLKREVEAIHRDTGHDMVKWDLEASDSFSSNSLYLKLCSGNTLIYLKEMWRTRVPLKIRVFLWQMIRGRLPSSDNIAKRLGPSDGRLLSVRGA